MPVWSLSGEDLGVGGGHGNQLHAGKSYGQSSLAGYSLWAHKDLDKIKVIEQHSSKLTQAT